MERMEGGTLLLVMASLVPGRLRTTISNVSPADGSRCLRLVVEAFVEQDPPVVRWTSFSAYSFTSGLVFKRTMRSHHGPAT
jgi:hypothetical protein